MCTKMSSSVYLQSAPSHPSAYIHELNTDTTLYRSLMTLVDDKEVGLPTEEQSVSRRI